MLFFYGKTLSLLCKKLKHTKINLFYTYSKMLILLAIHSKTL